ncbi:hypothetical protein [Pandoraea cepalis]|nr:hypothetical protein [Pandoraea cepalis]
MHSLTSDLPAYPPAVLKAYSVVFQHKFFKNLTSKSREILGEIVIRLSTQNLKKPIWFKRQNVAEKLQCDRKTVYNALRKLEHLGLIERHDQNVTAEGFFECSSISATPCLLQILGLDAASTYPQPTVRQNPDRGEISGRINRGFNNVYVVNEQPSGRAEKMNNPKPRKTLWDDEHLSFLRASGMSANGVYALMALCKKHRQRLSSVVACVKIKLEQLSRSQLFAYLQTCIQSGSNFTKKEAELQTDVSAKAKLLRYSTFLGLFIGKTLANATGRTVQVMEGASPVANANGVHIGSMPTQQVFELYESGELKITLSQAYGRLNSNKGSASRLPKSERSRMREHVNESNRVEQEFAKTEMFLSKYEGKVLRNLRGGYVSIAPGMCPAKDVDGNVESSVALAHVIESFEIGILFF